MHSPLTFSAKAPPRLSEDSRTGEDVVDVIPFLPLRPGAPQRFSYRVPVGLKGDIGMRVRIPVGQRSIEGVIWSRRRTTSRLLRPLQTILSGPLFHARERAWLEALAENSLESLALLTKSLVLVRRPLERLMTQKPLRQRMPHGRGSQARHILVHFTTDVLAALPQSLEGQILVLVPDNGMAQRLLEACGQAKLPAQRFSQALPLTQRRAVLTALNEGTPMMVIATHSGVFLPFSNLSRIIVVEATLPAHRQWDLHPRYDARLAALLLARTTNATIVYQSSLPSVELSALPESLAETVGELPQIPVQILARSADRDRPLLPETEARVRETIARGRAVLLFQNIVGMERSYRCGGCGYLLQCATCGQPLQRQGKSLACLACGLVHGPVRHFCPQCGSPRVLPRRIGTAAIEEEVQRLLPHVPTMRIDRDHVPREVTPASRLSAASRAEVDSLPTMYIATERIFSLASAPRFGLVVIVDADTLLAPLAFDAAEQALRLITRVAETRENAATEVLLQTSLPHFPLFRALAGGTLAEWLTEERRTRADLHVPPYGALLRFAKIVSSVTRARREIAAFRETLKNTPPVRLGWRVTEVQRRVRVDVLLRGPRSILFTMLASLPRSWSVDPIVPLTELSGIS